jgi:hypothetical protein
MLIRFLANTSNQQHPKTEEDTGSHQCILHISESLPQFHRAPASQWIRRYKQSPEFDVEHRSRPANLLVQVSRPSFRCEPCSQHLRDIDAPPAVCSVMKGLQEVFCSMVGKSTIFPQSREPVRAVASRQDRLAHSVTCHLSYRVICVGLLGRSSCY